MSWLVVTNGSRVEVSANVVRLSDPQHLIGEYLLLKDIYINDEYWRDHAFVKRSRRLRLLNLGDFFNATCKIKHYLDSENINKIKIGLTEFRNITALK